MFLRYVDNFSEVASFYSLPPTFASIKKIAKTLKFPAERRRAVSTILKEQNAGFGASEATGANLKLLADGAVAVVTGQQVGLFSGPAYAAYKALSAIQIAAELTRSGVRAVPVFWMATEDHDIDEVRHVSWFQDGKLIRYEVAAPENAGGPVGEIALGPEVEEMAESAAACLSAAGSELLARIFRKSYRAGETYGCAFARLFTELFAESGLILLDPLDPRLHKMATPLYRQALAQSDPLRERLLQRAKELDRAGFDAQVKVTSRSTLLFRLEDGQRRVLTQNGTKFSAGERTWERSNLERLAETEPEAFSANALLRPVVQDYLLPTVAYVAGPAEISYFAQAEVSYRALLGRMPVIVPRAGFTFVDAKAEKLLKKHGLKVEDVWGGPQTLRRRMESASVPSNLAADFATTRRQLENSLAKLREKTGKLDATLQGAVDTAAHKMNYQLEKLRLKTGRASDRKAGLLAQQESYLESLLHPHKNLQSRELCFLPILAKLGMNALGEIQQLSGSKSFGRHLIVRIP